MILSIPCQSEMTNPCIFKGLGSIEVTLHGTIHEVVKKPRPSYSETEFVLEYSSDELPVSMHLDAVPARVGHHNSGYTLDDGSVIPSHMNAEQTMKIYDCVILIDSFCCSTISYIVLSACCHIFPVPEGLKHP